MTGTGSFKDLEAIFKKQKIYKHQKEFRFAFNTNNKTKGSIKFNVGPLNEFAIILPSKDINSLLEIKIQ